MKLSPNNKECSQNIFANCRMGKAQRAHHDFAQTTDSLAFPVGHATLCPPYSNMTTQHYFVNNTFFSLTSFMSEFPHYLGIFFIKTLLIYLLFLSSFAWASPIDDRQKILDFYQQLFPQLPFEDYAEGVYAIDSDAKSSWLAIEEFPPYEFALEEGKTLFQQSFANGKSYADCFPNKGIAIAQNYPYWDKKNQQIVTLASAINSCREQNNIPVLPYSKSEINAIMAYMAYTSRGQGINTIIPENSEQALAAYEHGKAYFYQRRGQLNFSCAICHVDNAGKYIRSEVLSPALGHTSHWPVYRLNTGKLWSLHGRFINCNELIRAKVDPAQSTALRELEYFLSFMANGLPLNGPATRK